MSDRDKLVRNIRKAASGGEQAQAVAALDAYDSSMRAEAARERELDWAGDVVTATFGVGPMHGDRHTIATDWLGDFDDPRLDYRTAMAAEAATWMRRLPREVLADRSEFTAQARGAARTLASAYGPDALGARDMFLATVARMARQGASGLPQIDQVTDPHDQPSQTPYPTEVFDNFAPEQNDYNGGVESPAHDSQISSRDAPMLQQTEQMDGRGSGFGSGPEKPNEHSTSFDTSNSYAEVPLGPEGTIPAGSPGGAPSAPPSPAPVTSEGSPLDESDEDERGQQRTGSRYSLPDRLGYRWMISPRPEAYHPYHERCASSHWPDEDCSGRRPHIASVAIDHSMTLDQARQIARCEHYGMAEGQGAVRSSRGDWRVLAAHHNRLAAAWGATDRTAEDTAVLRGFQAVVRPVLAEAKDDDDDCADDGMKSEGKRRNKPKRKKQQPKQFQEGADKFRQASKAKEGKRRNKPKARPQKKKDKSEAFPGAAKPFGSTASGRPNFPQA